MSNAFLEFGGKWEKPTEYSFSCVEVLTELWGKSWNEYTLAMLQACRPSEVRVIRAGEGVQLDASTWRVTVYLDKEGRIKKIEQEAQVCLPAGIENGWELGNMIRYGHK